VLEGIGKQTTTVPQQVLQRATAVLDNANSRNDDALKVLGLGEGSSDQAKDTTNETLWAVSSCQMLVVIEIRHVLTYVKIFGIRSQRESHIK
jgi:hypothetical protein